MNKMTMSEQQTHTVVVDKAKLSYGHTFRRGVQDVWDDKRGHTLTTQSIYFANGTTHEGIVERSNETDEVTDWGVWTDRGLCWLSNFTSKARFAAQIRMEQDDIFPMMVDGDEL